MINVVLDRQVKSAQGGLKLRWDPRVVETVEKRAETSPLPTPIRINESKRTRCARHTCEAWREAQRAAATFAADDECPTVVESGVLCAGRGWNHRGKKKKKKEETIKIFKYNIESNERGEVLLPQYRRPLEAGWFDKGLHPHPKTSKD